MLHLQLVFWMLLFGKICFHLIVRSLGFIFVGIVCLSDHWSFDPVNILYLSFHILDCFETEIWMLKEILIIPICLNLWNSTWTFILCFSLFYSGTYIFLTFIMILGLVIIDRLTKFSFRILQKISGLRIQLLQCFAL